MTPDLRARTDRRTDATRRRTELTAATAVIGLVATAGFGWLAAETYAGSPKTDPTSATESTATQTAPTATSAPATSTPSKNGSTSDGSTTNGSSSSSSGSSSSG